MYCKSGVQGFFSGLWLSLFLTEEHKFIMCKMGRIQKMISKVLTTPKLICLWKIMVSDVASEETRNLFVLFPSQSFFLCAFPFSFLSVSYWPAFLVDKLWSSSYFLIDSYVRDCSKGTIWLPIYAKSILPDDTASLTYWLPISSGNFLIIQLLYYWNILFFLLHITGSTYCCYFYST